MIITHEQRSVLERLLPDAEAIIVKDDLLAILDALDDLYLELLDDDQEPTKESEECERIRDAIHFQNTHKD